MFNRVYRTTLVLLSLTAAGQAHALVTVEPGIDRFGGDYARGNGLTSEACQSQCVADVNCKAWAFVEPGYQGPQSVCYLKNAVGTRAEKTGVTSGVNLGSRSDYSNVILGVPFEVQEQTMWCWSAVSTAIINFYNGGASALLRQCQLAGERTGKACCANPTIAASAECNVGNTPIDPLSRRNLFQHEMSNDSLDSMEGEILGSFNGRRPSIYVIKWIGTSLSHVGILYGIRRSMGVLYHSVFDPARNAGHRVMRNGQVYQPNGYWISTLMTQRH